MKTCPHCKINIGGNPERCPLCQNLLTGDSEQAYWPQYTIGTKRKKAFKIVVFAVIAAIIINLAMDYLFITKDHPSWSPVVVAWLLVSGWLTESIIKKHYNLLKTLLVSLITVSFLCGITETYIHFAWDIPFIGITYGFIIPILCSANIVTNFVLSFIDKHFTDHSMIYMCTSILVGIAPCIAIFFYEGKPSLTWSICFVINTLALAGLIVFKGRLVISEFKKRFHM